jgi:hypothetical protein
LKRWTAKWNLPFLLKRHSKQHIRDSHLIQLKQEKKWRRALTEYLTRLKNGVVSNVRAERGPDGKLRRVRNRTEHERRANAAHKRAIWRVGIDGEGVQTEDGMHVYVMLQWADKTGKHSGKLIDPNGLKTKDILDFILAIPPGTVPFGFAFNYDLTKALEGLPDDKLYFLFRPELRRRIGAEAFKGPIKVWWLDYQLQMIGSMFSVKRGKKGRTRTVWDIFRFYQKRFTKALEDWQVCDPEIIKRIDQMKEKRETFHEGMIPAMSDYCFEECRYLADLAERLIEAHAHPSVDLELKQFYGAGSTAGALLKKLGAKNWRRDAGEVTERMQPAVAQSFFGGRFENSVIGVVNEPIYCYDICSAYPYQLRFLPCLEHGAWRKTRKLSDVERSRAALVQYTLESRIRSDATRNWGPFPFRTETGSVVFPYESGGGWVWREEFSVGASLFPHVGFRQAWVYDCNCGCEPFRAMSELYLARLALGKDGAGIVLKLGMNSVYGKLVQSIGSPQFQSWIWGSMITSGTRAMLLQVLALFDDWSDVYAFATDSVLCRKEVDAPSPLDTGTSMASEYGKRPLGAWDKKIEKRAHFLARPGIYYPVNATEKDVENIRARGIGRKHIVLAGPKLIDAWRNGQSEEIDLGTLRRFCGAKTSIHRILREKTWKYIRSPDYGKWIVRPIVASLNPLPKRSPNFEREGDLARLHLRSMRGRESAPYTRALNLESLQLKMFSEESNEQPEGAYDVEFGGAEPEHAVE